VTLEERAKLEEMGKEGYEASRRARATLLSSLG